MFWVDEVDFNEIIGCCTWLDFTDRSVMTISGTKISSIKDKSSYQNNFSQGTEQYQPDFTGSIHGRTCAFFNSALPGGTFLDASKNSSQIFLNNTDYEVFVSCRSVINTNKISFILSNTALTERCEIHLGGSAGYGVRFIPVPGVYADNTNSAQDAFAHVLCARVTDNVSVSSIDDIDGTPVLGGRNSITYTFRVGARFNLGFPFDGSISNIVIYNRKLSSIERAAIKNMLQRY